MSNKKQYDTDAQALEDLRVKIREIEWNADIAREAIRIAERYRTKADNQRIMLNQLQRGRFQGSDLIRREDAFEALRKQLDKTNEVVETVGWQDASPTAPIMELFEEISKIPSAESTEVECYVNGQMVVRGVPDGYLRDDIEGVIVYSDSFYKRFEEVRSERK